MCRDAFTGAIALSFGVRDDIANLTAHAKFYLIGSGIT